MLKWVKKLGTLPLIPKALETPSATPVPEPPLVSFRFISSLSWFLVDFGTFSGAIAATFVCPLDVIKTRLQVHGLPETRRGIKTWINYKTYILSRCFPFGDISDVYAFIIILINLSGSVIITSLGNILKKEGVRGMYRGLSPTIIALLPNWAVSFHLIITCSLCYLWSFRWHKRSSCLSAGVLLCIWKVKGSAPVKWSVPTTQCLPVLIFFA